uniref:outer membrane protein assembly factor n=1 Tax=Ningiella ruwaisensis TaxID=2364274 RepID=UPI0010A03461|nr:outer membrane protein assembly factor [Ningiella ruwaisensis]
MHNKQLMKGMLIFVFLNLMLQSLCYARENALEPSPSDSLINNTACKLNAIPENQIEEESVVVGDIFIEPLPIFDENDPDSIPLHRWANAFHIVTKPFVIRERLTFDEGDTLSPQDLKEAESILRSERFIANANIRVAPVCNEDLTHDILVTTYDNWSLIPTFSFSRSGGNNKTIIGVREDNLLGLGIRTRLRYNSDEQRSGYQLSFSSAFPGVRHSNVYLDLVDNDDGERYQFVFDKPFFHLGTKRMYFAEYLDDKRVEDIFQNDQTRNSIDIEHRRVAVATGWNVGNSRQETQRISIGFTDERSVFRIDESSPSSNPLFLPDERNYQYPWIQFDYVQRNIAVLQDVYLIQQPEDINLGWQFSTKLGLELSDVADGDEFGYHLDTHAQKAWQYGASLFVAKSQFSADINTTAKDRMLAHFAGEYFYRANDILGYYSRLSATFSSGQFKDLPIVIDDDNGVRGYANQYQHGDNRISASVEARFYTDYNIYQLFNLGFAVFADVGRAFSGELAQFNEDDGILASTGLGARLYSNKASTPGVIHIDLSTPLSDGESVDSWAISLQMRNSF